MNYQKKSKEIAIGEYIVFLMESDEKSFVYDSILKAEKARTPWFAGEIIWEDHKDQVLQNLKNLDLQFLKNGTLFGN